jgi:hypothetical protein
MYDNILIETALIVGAVAYIGVTAAFLLWWANKVSNQFETGRLFLPFLMLGVWVTILTLAILFPMHLVRIFA